MNLQSVTQEHLHELMSWFKNEQEYASWFGPGYCYPYTPSSFTEALKINKTPSFTLLAKNNVVLAFGQYYQRLGKCHLARLIVNPQMRGKGIASHLIDQLSAVGMKEIGANACSLFVFPHNEPAVRSYKKQGFKIVKYPDGTFSEECLYMLRESFRQH